ncbi:alginate export family protein [Nannocystis sp. SCPEA4]|uniref:alginate export family protein n=1 Tax=Nannocystis sp. SCPEA4 TaxID=2996787 RepID=UPI002271C7D0|nr:alginate export family protein [Nannocystis sp. SCPEA4]MCY1059286.1 alginate export family protein [Nannocystis sp. SCPEA4]
MSFQPGEARRPGPRLRPGARAASTAALAVTLGAPSGALGRPAIWSIEPIFADGLASAQHPASAHVPTDSLASTQHQRIGHVPTDSLPVGAALARRDAAPAQVPAPAPDHRGAPPARASVPAAMRRPPALNPGSPAQSASATEATALAGRGEGPPAAPPPYRLLRADEDYRYLRDRGRRADLLDVLKYIPLGPRRRVALGFGGETRQRLDWSRNLDWGAGPPRSLSWTQRYMFHAELRAPYFRAFAQVKSGLETGRPGGPRAIDRDDFDFHQAFADFDLDRPGLRLIVRAGRHELAFGSGRLVSPREGPNVRRSFDGVSVILSARRVHAHLFVTRPVATLPGVLDDGWERGQWFAGAYLTVPSPLRGGQVDVYALYLDRPDAEYHRGRAHERRLSLGTRWFGAAGRLDYNVEAVLQTGRFGAAPLLAWTVASDTGVRLPLPWDPRLGVRLDVASGDRGPGRPFGTFSALFPKGSYFGEDALVGPANFLDAHPMLSLTPVEPLSLTLDWVFLGRYSLADGLYNVPGEPTIADAGGARFVGHRAGATLEAELGRHVGFVVTVGRFFRGPFLAQAGRTRDVDFLATWLTLKF